MTPTFRSAVETVLRHEGGYVGSLRTAESIKVVIDKALFIESQKAASIFIQPKNSRSHQCSVELCTRQSYAGGFCNAHYIRSRKNIDLATPIRARKRHDICCECGKTTGQKGGWGLCSKHYKKKRYNVIKDACISALGNCCQSCRGVFHRSVFDFHHIDQKDKNPSSVLSNESSFKIADELSKCVLLCANCHRIEHHGDE